MAIKKHHLFILAAIATILVAISMDYLVSDVTEHMISSTETASPSTFTDYKLPSNEFTKSDQLSMPMPVIGAGNVWSNYNRNDYGIFTYSPFEPQNEQNEDVLHHGDDHRQAELRAIFQKKYCFNGQLKLTDQASVERTVLSPGPDPSILSKLSFPNAARDSRWPLARDTRKCNPCSEKCEFTIMDSDRKLETEEFLVRPKGSDSDEVYARLEQVWTRVFHGVREIFI